MRTSDRQRTASRPQEVGPPFGHRRRLGSAFVKGDLSVIQRERQQSKGGRIDFLMSDPETSTMYEVEVMLGATDESHIIVDPRGVGRGRSAVWTQARRSLDAARSEKLDWRGPIRGGTPSPRQGSRLKSLAA